VYRFNMTAHFDLLSRNGALTAQLIIENLATRPCGYNATADLADKLSLKQPFDLTD
jgi:hypothetical protein